jgi:hypothetical protein
MREPPDILREYRVKIIPAAEAAPQPDHSKNIGTRTKFGGLPDGTQSGDDLEVRCPECSAKMHFVGQIDSFEYNGKNNPNRKDYGQEQFMFGDVGMIYLWFCFDCLKPHATMECY